MAWESIRKSLTRPKEWWPYLIFSKEPDDWRALQSQVATILRDCGIASEIEKEIHLIRGKSVVDVYAEDFISDQKEIILCECKYWNKKVPKEVVHAFRTIVLDSGANRGILISKKGFQKGAYEAIGNTNIQLLNFLDFQKIYARRWIIGKYISMNNMRNIMMEKSDIFYEPLISLESDKKIAWADIMVKYFKYQSFGIKGFDLGVIEQGVLPKLPIECSWEEGGRLTFKDYASWMDFWEEKLLEGINAYETFFRS